MDASAVGALARRIFPPGVTLNPDDQKRAKAMARRLAKCLGPQADDVRRQALVGPMVASLRGSAASEAAIAKEVLQLWPEEADQESQPGLPPAGDRKDKKSSHVNPPPPPMNPARQGHPPSLAVKQAIEKARAEAWEKRADNKGLNSQEEAALAEEINRLKAEEEEQPGQAQST